MANNDQPSLATKQKFQKAMLALNAGDPKKAIRLFEKVRREWRNDPDILYLEGGAYGKLNDPESVKKVSELALRINPNHFGVLCNMGNALMMLHETDEALAHYERAIALQPDAPDILDNYGRALGLLGRRDEAVELYQKALAAKPDYAPAHSSLGRAYNEAGNPHAAMQEFRRALEIDPRDLGAHLGIASLLSGTGGLTDAERHFREAMQIDPNCLAAYTGLANVKRYYGELEESLDLLDKAEKLAGREDATIEALRADVLERSGKAGEAFDIVTILKEQEHLTPTALAVFTRVCRKFDACDEAIELLDKVLDVPSTNSPDKQNLLFAAGEMMDKLGRYDEAFDYFKRANEEVPCPFDRNYEEKFNAIMECFSKEAMEKFPHAAVETERPIFILGMPRSGTSLTEQILASHPRVFGAGELGDIKQLTLQLGYSDSTVGRVKELDYLGQMAGVDEARMNELAEYYLDVLNDINSTADFVTDKMPHNFQYVGLISLLFPKARIIHCRRNPLDNCLSIYFQSFIWSHDYATELGRLGEFYTQYDRLMNHWKAVVDTPILDVQYEDMVADQEGMSRKLLEFCGLEWDDAVLDFHKADRIVATASYDQVRQPIYKTSRARWKNYANYLGPLRDALPEPVREQIEDIRLIP